MLKLGWAQQMAQYLTDRVPERPRQVLLPAHYCNKEGSAPGMGILVQHRLRGLG